MEERLIGEIELNDKIRVRLLDKSRLLAGDRYYVCLEARAHIPYGPQDLEGVPDKAVAMKALRGIYGNTIPYVYKQERHFIGKNEKEMIMKTFIDNFMENKMQYLMKENFRKKAVLSKLRELRREKPEIFVSSYQ